MYDDLYLRELYVRLVEEYKLSSEVAERVLNRVLSALSKEKKVKQDSS